MWKQRLKEIIDVGSNEYFDLLDSPTDFIDKYDNFVIFGAGGSGAKTKEYLDKLGKNVMYFVDNDINKKGTKFLGKTVKHPSEILMFENKVLIASVWWREIKQQLEVDFGLIGAIDSFIVSLESKMELENTQSNFLLKLKNDFDNYLKVFDLLDDEVSKAIYYRILKGRVFYGGLNPLFPPMPMVSYQQYSHSQVKPENGDCIVDAGAYTGDTIEEIIKENITYKKIYAFEPDDQNYAKLIENTKIYQNIEAYKYGLWDKADKLYFNAEANMGSSIASNIIQANQTIDTISLDEFFKDKEKPTLIKMDIEGAELNALLGAKEIICNYKPKLQICIYHKPEHLYQIPILLKEWVKDYKLYIGHHTYGFGDTVLYAKR
ncbi:Methyltransferase FkbM [Desulfurella amilsii]|uniref:Methyltransferase FkbM n=1 Tax=Desulfurella amilsii TaxID=1562698 RepID=A0A1X4XUH8_9BACT|nr:FkbM family methyltransferase [Desulfurella amilsii]OSS41184.1 Methyltransferase FkbM [Desulfurella amilsii]